MLIDIHCGIWYDAGMKVKKLNSTNGREVKQMTRIEELIGEQEDLKGRLRHVQQQLTDEVMQFQGTLRDALEMQLVRLNFAAPAGFHRHLKSMKKGR